MGTSKVDKNYSRSVEGQIATEQMAKIANSPSIRTTDLPSAETTDPLLVNWQNQGEIPCQRGQSTLRERKRRKKEWRQGRKPQRMRLN